MPFEHCSLCGKLFNKEKSDLCPECTELENSNIDKILNFLKKFDNTEVQNLTVETLSQETGLEIKEIERLYRTDKLRACVSMFGMKCKLCGETFKPTIFTGYLCKNCSSKVEKIATELKETGADKLSPMEKFAQIIKSQDDKGMHLR
jgi:DNA-directed RNA polymerase subunit RPC12/RpoP